MSACRVWNILHTRIFLSKDEFGRVGDIHLGCTSLSLGHMFDAAVCAAYVETSATEGSLEKERMGWSVCFLMMQYGKKAHGKSCAGCCEGDRLIEQWWFVPAFGSGRGSKKSSVHMIEYNVSTRIVLWGEIFRMTYCTTRRPDLGSG